MVLFQRTLSQARPFPLLELAKPRTATLAVFMVLISANPLFCQVTAQPAPTKPAASSTPAPSPDSPLGQNATKLALEADKVEASLPDTDLPRRASFELTPEQQDHFKKLLPNTYRKLSQRQPFHIVALGDSVVNLFGYDEDNENWLKGYPAIFAKELANQFFYTGGVRIIKPSPGKEAKDMTYMGPEITLRNLGRGGKLMLHAMQALTTYGLENPPDLVLVSFGINDATFGMDLADYAAQLQEVIDTTRASGAELVLLAPTLTVNDPPEADLALTRPYADVMREVAADNNLFFVDLGDLQSLAKIPTDLSEPAAMFESVVSQYRRFFDHADRQDFTHGRASLHARLGQRDFQELLDGPIPSPWAVDAATVTLGAGDTLTLSYRISNTTEETQTLTLLPLVMRGWKPLEAVPQIVIKPGKSKSVTATYAKRESHGLGHFNALPSGAPVLRVPILISAGGAARIADLRATILPVCVLWKCNTTFNAENTFAPENILVNTSATAVKGKWEARWMDQQCEGTFETAAGDRTPLEIRFPLPDAAKAPHRQHGKLALIVTAGTTSLRFDREVELTRNIALKEAVPMSSYTVQASPAMPDVASGTNGVSFKADADKDNLFMTFEIIGQSLQDDPITKNAWALDINIDARSYGKRLTFGSTDPLRFTGPAADGPGKINSIPPWAFGTGYAAQFDENFVKANLTSGANGVRRLTVTIPRAYLYLHDWTLGNGNSQLGINAALLFWQPSPGPGKSAGYLEDTSFSLIRSGRHRDDAQALTVLELTEKATPRWTINLY
ncbi:MAG: SGNH/GDSL hydrolase family protein [Verrucomicrobiales bacterium]|nr:SGNH/GDSL hydrolase family protein [Verrucomicrobiales bacterium]